MKKALLLAGGSLILCVVALYPLLVRKAQAAAEKPRSEMIYDEKGKPVSIHSRTSVDEMREFHRQHPDVKPEVAPFMPAPPPAGVGPKNAGETPASPRDNSEAPQLKGDDSFSNKLFAPPLSASFQGAIDNNTVAPPDTDGAIGPNHAVELLNNGFTVYDKSGGVVSPPISFQAFWSSLGTAAGQPASVLTDPKIIYDQYENRWVVVSNGNPTQIDGTNNNWVLVGISQTNDPTGNWNLYSILTNAGVDAGKWADFPGLGLDPNNVIITENMFAFGAALPSHADVVVISKASLKAGMPIAEGVDFTRFHDPAGIGLRGFTYQPCHTFGQTPATAVNYLIEQGFWDDATQKRRFLTIIKVNGTGAGASVDAFGGNNFIEVDQYNFNQLNADQFGCAAKISTNDTRLCNAVLRNGKIWTSHSVGIGADVTLAAPPSRTEIAWYEIDPLKAGAFPGGSPEQQGHISHASGSYYMPSIAVNNDECMALGFSGSDSGSFAGCFYTLRSKGDPTGQTQPVGLLQAGKSIYLKTGGGILNRWGDYSSTVIDPSDDATFWTLQEYAEGGGSCIDQTGTWGTWWGSFACPGSGSIHASNYINLQASPGAIISGNAITLSWQTDFSTWN